MIPGWALTHGKGVGTKPDCDTLQEGKAGLMEGNGTGMVNGRVGGGLYGDSCTASGWHVGVYWACQDAAGGDDICCDGVHVSPSYVGRRGLVVGA